jgi:hypothetical protein
MALMCAVVGIALTFAHGRGAWVAAGALAATALVAWSLPVPSGLDSMILSGLWLSMIVTAALALLPRGLSQAGAIALAVNGGAWIGALGSLSSSLAQLAIILPPALLFMLGKWLSSRGYAIVAKVVLSWMMAVAVLSFFVSLMPTPGYVPDHME